MNQISLATRKKMSLSRLKFYARGGTPWNKGKICPYVHGNKWSFKGDKAGKNAGNHRAQVKFKIPKPCKVCKKLKPSFQMIRHHKNGNTLDNMKRNIMWLCRSCHINIHRKELLEARKMKHEREIIKI